GRIDMVLLLTGLARMRGEDGMARATARDAAHAALSGRIRIADGCDRSPESVLDELLGGFWPEDAPAPLPPDGRVPGAGDGVPDGRGKASGLPPEAAGTGQRRGSASAGPPDRAGHTAPRAIRRAQPAP